MSRQQQKLTKHWFTAYLTEYYSKNKKLGLDLGSGQNIWKEFFQCPRVGFDLPIKMKNKDNEQPDVCGTGFFLPFPENTFDFITCYSVLLYIKDIEKFVNEMYRVIKPNGVVVVIIQNPRATSKSNKGVLVHKYDSKTLQKILQSGGFKSIKHKNFKTLFYSNYFNLTSVYAYAIVEPKKHQSGNDE